MEILTLLEKYLFIYFNVRYVILIIIYIIIAVKYEQFNCISEIIIPIKKQ